MLLCSFIQERMLLKNAKIRVAVKIKPCPEDKRGVKVDLESGEVVVQLPSDEVQRVEVDKVHDANATEKSIYENAQIKESIGKFVEGYNVAILTYGQTGSGKTFAFEGDKSHPGIIFQAITDIYTLRSSSAVVKCSFVQLYNERITDMLNAEPGGQRGLKMRWQAQRQFVIEDLIEKECASSQEMIRQWGLGNKNRVIASNKIHQYSSRSHSIFTVIIEDQDEENNCRVRRIHFVDLAGSERVFSPVGRLSKEAIEINKSLFFLRKVILSLQEMSTSEKEQYIPYRDSKLTSILKSSFGGNCLTYLIACINPREDFLEETISTLQYAVSASKIHNKAAINIDQKSREIRTLREQKESLKRELQVAMLQIQAFKSLEREEQVKRAANSEYASRIIECIGTVRELLKSNKVLRAQLEQERLEKKRIAQELQRAEKGFKTAKRSIYLQPIKETFEPRKSKKSQSVQISRQTLSDRQYSHSVQVFSKKEKGSAIIHRKRFFLHEGSSNK